ncbi:MAG: hypothetical protein RL481_905 [Pseudomonadota bacterium]|jgi:uncharacterized protein
MRARGLQVKQRHWVRGEAYPTAFFNALSAVFPVGETFMIESLRPWQKRVPEPLASEVRTFIEQEAAHSREHAGMNRALIRAGYDIAPLDKVIRGFVTFFADTSDITKLGATVCIEHLTAIIAAELLARPEHLDGAEPEMKRLFLWHAIEEVEHKAVAYDVWMHATRDWSRFRRWATRSAMMIGVTTSFFINRTRGQVELMRQDGEHWTKALPGILRYGFEHGGIGRAVLRPWARFLKPGFHPWHIDDHALIAEGEAMVAALEPAPMPTGMPVESPAHRPALAA